MMGYSKVRSIMVRKHDDPFSFRCSCDGLTVRNLNSHARGKWLPCAEMAKKVFPRRHGSRMRQLGAGGSSLPKLVVQISDRFATRRWSPFCATLDSEQGAVATVRKHMSPLAQYWSLMGLHAAMKRWVFVFWMCLIGSTGFYLFLYQIIQVWRSIVFTQLHKWKDFPALRTPGSPFPAFPGTAWPSSWTMRTWQSCLMECVLTIPP
jgi:hypothetical protein